jgi:hypothetical protein
MEVTMTIVKSVSDGLSLRETETGSQPAPGISGGGSPRDTGSLVPSLIQRTPPSPPTATRPRTPIVVCHEQWSSL